MAGEKDDMKGRAKEALGDLSDNDEMKREGQTDRAAGSVKGKVDDVVDSVKDKMK